MKPDDFESSIESLLTNHKKLPARESTGVASFLDEVHGDGALEDLRIAWSEYEAGNLAGAWPYVVRAAETIGRLRGLSEAAERNTSAQGVVELLRKNGSKGGTTKGRNAEQKRDEAAKALIAAAPSGKWPSKVAFDLKYHGIVKTVPGFRDTDHHRRKIMMREDIKATLPRAVTRKR